MRFKSEKCWLKNKLRTANLINSKPKSSIFCFFGLMLWGAIFGSPWADATMTVNPVNQVFTQNLTNVSGGIAYYPATSPTAAATSTPEANLLIDDSDTSKPNTILDLTMNQASDTGHTDPVEADYSNAIYFNVYSDNTGISHSGSQDLVVYVTTTGTTGVSKVVPIALVAQTQGSGQSPSLCSGSSCTALFTQTVTSANVSVSYYGAVPYTPKSWIQIGIYPQDLCWVYNQQVSGVSANGCSGATVTAISGQSIPIPLTFNIGTFDTTSAAGTAPTSAGETSSLSLFFETQSPTLACPSDKSSLYYPGDSQIFLNTSNFGFASNPPGNSLPSTLLVLVGNPGNQPDYSSNYPTNNFNVQRLNLGVPSAPVTGLTNLTPYNMAFMVRDVAGLIAPPTAQAVPASSPPAGSCGLEGVESEAINGFLKESKCFIASAAFRSGRVVPVMILRQFRDRILLHYGLGRSFVSWYYRWSPGAADWLLANPAFRYPVIAALGPLVGLAWLILHPFMGLLFTLGGVLVGALWAWKKMMPEGEL